MSAWRAVRGGRCAGVLFFFFGKKESNDIHHHHFGAASICDHIFLPSIPLLHISALSLVSFSSLQLQTLANTV